MSGIETFDENNFSAHCDRLAKKDGDLKIIIDAHGYPPVWSRIPNFETLIHIILEQQVSQASARSALNKLKEKTSNISPEKVLLLSDAEMKSCYFSKQKTSYAKHLAASIISKELILEELTTEPDDVVRAKLKKIKGIGDWTADVYLMMALQRTDLFPAGDIALVSSMKEIKNLGKYITKEEIFQIAAKWKPYRTIAAYLLWHAYIKKRKINV
jgi:DNA-3-methyladenine glycosylase II